MPAKVVSFVIPSYNSAHTIRRCLDSIYALSLKPSEFEIIFVDDCSTDNTRDIVAEYQTKYPNITLLCQSTNNRQGAARNRGVSIAKGEYICFVDSDDAVMEGIVTAIRTAKEKQTDMTALHFGYANEQGIITSEAERLNFAKQEVFSGIEMQNKHAYWCSAPWGFIYRTEYIQKINHPFAEGVLYEDSDFIVVHQYYAQRMTYSSELGYIAYYREGSTTHNNSYKNTVDYLFLGARMLRFYESIVEANNATGDAQREKFAEGILEGACWNVQKSCKRIIKLANVTEACAYYERLDANIDRKAMCADVRLRKYYWNTWTTLCLKHKYITIALLTILIPMYKIAKRIRK